jgi:hypothetical protein
MSRPIEYGGDYLSVPYSIVLNLETIITAKLVLHGKDLACHPVHVTLLTGCFDVHKALKYHHTLSSLSFPEGLVHSVTKYVGDDQGK